MQLGRPSWYVPSFQLGHLSVVPCGGLPRFNAGKGTYLLSYFPDFADLLHTTVAAILQCRCRGGIWLCAYNLAMAFHGFMLPTTGCFIYSGSSAKS